MNFDFDTVRMRIWTIKQIAASSGVSYYTARQQVLHAETLSDDKKAKALSKITGTEVTAAMIGGNNIYAAGGMACGMNPQAFGDGSFLKNLFAFITDPANQEKAMKFLQFIMTLIALFPKMAGPILKTIEGIDFNRISAGISELKIIQDDFLEKVALANNAKALSDSANNNLVAAVNDVATAQSVFESESNYLKDLIDQKANLVDPAVQTAAKPENAEPETVAIPEKLPEPTGG